MTTKKIKVVPKSKRLKLYKKFLNDIETNKWVTYLCLQLRWSIGIDSRTSDIKDAIILFPELSKWTDGVKHTQEDIFVEDSQVWRKMVLEDCIKQIEQK